jgi:hypothetical protein
MADISMDNEVFDRANSADTPAGPYTDTAGDLGDADGTPYYIPTLYAKKVLYDFYKSTVWKEVTNTDYEGEFKKQGDTIRIRQAPEMTIRDYVKGDVLTYEVPAENATSMTISYGKYVAFQVDDIDAVQMDVDLMNMYATDAAERLKIRVDIDVLTAMAAGAHANNTGNTAGLISGNIALGAAGAANNIEVDRTNALDKIVELGQALDEQNIPQADRFVIIPAWYASRLKLSDIKAADFSGDNTGVVRTGLIGMIDGCKIYVNNSVYSAAAVGDTPATEWSVVAGHKLATSFALQLSKIDALKIPTSFGEYWRTLWVYGIKAVRTEALAKLICNPN